MDFSSFNNDFDNCVVPAIERLFNNDTQLRMFEKDIRKRYGMFEKTKRLIEEREGMDRFTRSYEEFGVVVMPDGGVRCLEWAPNAEALYLQGDFSNWEKMAYKRTENGKWELVISPNRDGSCPISHMSELKLIFETTDGRNTERISPWARYVVQRGSGSKYNWLFWNPPKSQLCSWKKMSSLPKPDRFRIYETHFGLVSDRSEMSAYRKFAKNFLPKIRDLGYNCILLTGIMEHLFDSSFGYQENSFFAPSSRHGTPEDLIELIHDAHGMGLCVIMDVMHNQVSRRMYGKIGMCGESEKSYLDYQKIEYRSQDKSRSFDYSNWEHLRFLMSNLRYYMEEFCFDGFRFNVATSMMYNIASFDLGYNEDYRTFFGDQINFEVMVYFMLVNDMLHRFYPNAITIAEDYSSMPALCRPVCEGGIGFDYRSVTILPEKWQNFRQFLMNGRDDGWDIEHIFEFLKNDLRGEKNIACLGNYEQNLREKMRFDHQRRGCEYTFATQSSIPSDCDLSLLKMMQLMAYSLSEGGYMKCAGNEVGHEDWKEFSSTNSNSGMISGRQFRFAEDDHLRCKYLNRFDAAMNRAEERFGWLRAEPAFISGRHNVDKVVFFERAGLLFIFNFHPHENYSDYRVDLEHNRCARYKIILNTGDQFFGGQGRYQHHKDFTYQLNGLNNGPCSLRVNLPSRSAIVLASDDVDFNCFYSDKERRNDFYKEQESSYGYLSSRDASYNTNQSFQGGSYNGSRYTGNDQYQRRRSSSFSGVSGRRFSDSGNYRRQQGYHGNKNYSGEYRTDDMNKYGHQQDGYSCSFYRS